MLKGLSSKEINYVLNQNGYGRVKSYNDLRRVLGNSYVRPKRSFETDAVLLKRINSAIFGG